MEEKHKIYANPVYLKQQNIAERKYLNEGIVTVFELKQRALLQWRFYLDY